MPLLPHVAPDALPENSYEEPIRITIAMPYDFPYRTAASPSYSDRHKSVQRHKTARRLSVQDQRKPRGKIYQLTLAHLLSISRLA